jgi:hypothetical protein
MPDELKQFLTLEQAMDYLNMYAESLGKSASDFYDVLTNYPERINEARGKLAKTTLKLRAIESFLAGRVDFEGIDHTDIHVAYIAFMEQAQTKQVYKTQIDELNKLIERQRHAKESLDRIENVFEQAHNVYSHF